MFHVLADMNATRRTERCLHIFPQCTSDGIYRKYSKGQSHFKAREEGDLVVNILSVTLEEQHLDFSSSS